MRVRNIHFARFAIDPATSQALITMLPIPGCLTIFVPFVAVSNVFEDIFACSADAGCQMRVKTTRTLSHGRRHEPESERSTNRTSTSNRGLPSRIDLVDTEIQPPVGRTLRRWHGAGAWHSNFISAGLWSLKSILSHQQTIAISRRRRNKSRVLGTYDTCQLLSVSRTTMLPRVGPCGADQMGPHDTQEVAI